MSKPENVPPVDWAECDRRYDEAKAHLFYQKHVWLPARMAEVERMQREAEAARKTNPK